MSFIYPVNMERVTLSGIRSWVVVEPFKELRRANETDNQTRN